MNETPIPQSAQYDPADIATAFQLAKQSQHQRGNSFSSELRKLCAERGYVYLNFKRWLIRNGLRVYTTKKPHHRYQKGYCQITINFPPEEAEKIRQAQELSKFKKRTRLAHAAVMLFVDEVLKRADKGTPTKNHKDGGL